MTMMHLRLDLVGRGVVLESNLYISRQQLVGPMVVERLYSLEIAIRTM